MEDLQRQLRIAMIAILIIIPLGVLGFMIIEQKDPLQAVWITIITLTSIGYGDDYARSTAGKMFTILLVLVGMGAILFALQTSFALFASPALREARQRRRTQYMIEKLENHYIICGTGELVDKTINYLLAFAQNRHKHDQERIYQPVDQFLDSIFGDDDHGHHVRMRRVMRAIYLVIMAPFYRRQNILDAVVVVTQNKSYGDHLRANGFLVIEGDATDESILINAGIIRAQAIMVLLENDTESLLTVLTANKLNTNVYITAATLEEHLAPKVAQVGANSVIAPYETAGQFLNNATLRPAVSHFFGKLLFEDANRMRFIQLIITPASPWIGLRLGALRLREGYRAGVIGVRLNDGSYIYAPDDDFLVKESETLLVAVHNSMADDLYRAANPNLQGWLIRPDGWRVTQSLSTGAPPPSEITYDLDTSAETIAQMSQHFIICGSSRVARNAINKLNPERPFVVISDDAKFSDDLLKRGFRVVQGNPTQEETLRKAGVERAQAIMISIEDRAESVVTVLTCRALSKRLLITATANTDDMIDKLRRAGADSVVSPFHVAAQFVLLATTRPEISDFMKSVLFNYETGLETTELYMENDSPWIGETIESLRLERLFRAGVIGIRGADRETYLYAPPKDYVIQAQEVLIVITPMNYSDELLASAHGSFRRRPTTLRRKVLQSGTWSRDMIKEIMKQAEEEAD